MTRIIAGTAGGLRLAVPASGTRPTSERVRESLFGALESTDAILNTRVLDLYAGSGALALEALSRGAHSADLVERASSAAKVATANARTVSTATGLPARVHTASVASYLRSDTKTYDLVFIDPPYDLADAELDEVLALLRPRLSSDALVVVERGRRAAAPSWSAAQLDMIRERTYGDTTVLWAQPSDESQSR